MKTSPPPGRKTRATRILAIASGGGHWVQLLRLRPALAGEDIAYVTVNEASRAEAGPARFYVVNDATRWNKFGVVILAVRIALILLRERPDVVITTGAAPGFVGIVLGKLMGARTCWIDSLANVECVSMCGSKVGRWADLWLTQWPELAGERGPDYEGAVL